MSGVQNFPVMRETSNGRQLPMMNVVVVAVIAAGMYSIFGSGSMGACSGGFSTEGFVEGRGLPTSQSPLCLNVAFRPHPLVYLVIAAIAVATGFARAATAAGPVMQRRVLTVGALTIVAVALVATATQFAPLHQHIIANWLESNSFVTPPFANVVVEVGPGTSP